MYDKTIRELQQMGITTTLTIYPTSAPINTTNQPPPPVNPDTPSPAHHDSPYTPSAKDLADKLNEVATLVSKDAARNLLGEGKTLEDVTDPSDLYIKCQEAINAVNPF